MVVRPAGEAETTIGGLVSSFPTIGDSLTPPASARAALRLLLAFPMNPSQYIACQRLSCTYYMLGRRVSERGGRRPRRRAEGQRRRRERCGDATGNGRRPRDRR